MSWWKGERLDLNGRENSSSVYSQTRCGQLYLNLIWPSVGDKDCLPYCFYIQSGLHRINVNWPSIKYSKQFICWMSHGHLNINWPSFHQWTKENTEKQCRKYASSSLHEIRPNIVPILRKTSKANKVLMFLTIRVWLTNTFDGKA